MSKPLGWGWCVATLLALQLAGGASVARGAAPGEPVLVSPTQGRPVFVAPDESFPVVIQFTNDPGTVRFEVVSRSVPAHRRPLPATEIGDPSDGGPQRYELKVPADLPEQTYDLKISTEAGVIVGRHCVAVARIGRRVRFVHLSNMNIGDVGAPTFDRQLVDEVNTVAPTLIIATGDFLDATNVTPQHGWEELSEYLACFDAPVLAACGDHDNVSLFSQTLAPSALGTLTMGRYEGIVLYDVPRQPITTDPDQIAWVERELAQPGPRLRFIVSHDDRPNLLAYWHEQGTLTKMLRGGRIGLWFSGGHRDWDGREYKELIDAATPMLYLRTQQSSTTTREGGDGVSHYRIVDLDDDRALLYGGPSETSMPGSIPVGRLKVMFDGPNDGTRKSVALTAVSALPFRMNHLEARVLVQHDGDERPWCHGARLKRLVDMGSLWECRIAFDLPDKGALRAVVGVGDEPAEPNLDVRFDVPRRVELKRVTAGNGVRYRTAEDTTAVVHIENRGTAAVTVEPLVRLNGETVAYRVVNEEGPFATAYRLRLTPGTPLALQLELSVGRVEAGRRELQVYLRGGVSEVPVCWPLDVEVSE